MLDPSHAGKGNQVPNRQEKCLSSFVIGKVPVKSQVGTLHTLQSGSSGNAGLAKRGWDVGQTDVPGNGDRPLEGHVVPSTGAGPLLSWSAVHILAIEAGGERDAIAPRGKPRGPWKLCPRDWRGGRSPWHSYTPGGPTACRANGNHRPRGGPCRRGVGLRRGPWSCSPHLPPIGLQGEGWGGTDRQWALSALVSLPQARVWPEARSPQPRVKL